WFLHGLSAYLVCYVAIERSRETTVYHVGYDFAGREIEVFEVAISRHRSCYLLARSSFARANKGDDNRLAFTERLLGLFDHGWHFECADDLSKEPLMISPKFVERDSASSPSAVRDAKRFGNVLHDNLPRFGSAVVHLPLLRGQIVNTLAIFNGSFG